MGIGRRIRELRLRSNKTQRELAEETGLAVAHVSRLENGRMSPSVRTLSKVSATLGVPVAELFGSAPVLDPEDRCPVSISGGCILEHGFVGRGRRPKDREAYSADHLERLRQCNYLLLMGNRRVRETLSMVIESLLTVVEKDEANWSLGQSDRTEPEEGGLSFSAADLLEAGASRKPFGFPRDYDSTRLSLPDSPCDYEPVSAAEHE